MKLFVICALSSFLVWLEILPTQAVDIESCEVCCTKIDDIEIEDKSNLDDVIENCVLRCSEPCGNPKRSRACLFAFQFLQDEEINCDTNRYLEFCDLEYRCTLTPEPEIIGTELSANLSSSPTASPTLSATPLPTQTPTEFRTPRPTTVPTKETLQTSFPSKNPTATYSPTALIHSPPPSTLSIVPTAEPTTSESSNSSISEREGSFLKDTVIGPAVSVGSIALAMLSILAFLLARRKKREEGKRGKKQRKELEKMKAATLVEITKTRQKKKHQNMSTAVGISLREFDIDDAI